MAFRFLHRKNRNAAKRFEKGRWGSGKKGKTFEESFSLLPRSQINHYWEQSELKSDLGLFLEAISKVFKNV